MTKRKARPESILTPEGEEKLAEAVASMNLTDEDIASIYVPTPEPFDLKRDGYKLPGGQAIYLPGYIHRSLPGVEAWVPYEPEDEGPKTEAGDPLTVGGWPVGAYALEAIGFPKPPGGDHSHIYAWIPTAPATPEWRASTPAGEFIMRPEEAGVRQWEKFDETPAATAASSGIGLDKLPAPPDRPVSDMSVRIRRLHGLQ